MTKVHPVHLITNVEQRQSAADNHTKPIDLGCESVYKRTKDEYRIQGV